MSLKTKRFHLTTGILIASMFALSACEDLKGIKSISDLGRKVDPIPGTKVKKTIKRPKPDERGVISYPNYQVIVATRSDTMEDLAARVGISADELARYNGLNVDHAPRNGEVLALPKTATRPVAPVSSTQPSEPAAKPADSIETIAETALDDVPNEPAKIPTGPEPERHIVKPGETAFTIARKYGVSVTALASWNGLNNNFDLREGQQLLIPVEERVASIKPTSPKKPQPRPDNVSSPGERTAIPLPPSAPDPLPKPVAKPVVAVKPDPPAERKPVAQSRKLLKPVNGKILRGYSSKPGGNEGIDFGAPIGTPIKAAENGTVALTSNSVNNTTIILIRHPDNLYTVYSNVGEASVKKGQKVTRGQTIGKITGGKPPFVHFEVRRGTEAEDPIKYLE